MPDRFGGVRVVILSLIVECIRQGLMFMAGAQDLVFLGSALSGFGFSLAVPALGIEALKQIPTQNRGRAMGFFLAFFDLSFCISGAISRDNDAKLKLSDSLFIGCNCAF
ncbi:hypothetical protein [Rickettsiella endosymbiont of Xylota segnis]|uniref:hypothetical protein n=1 Tax=Rickettsiella endosymbiont of Xylota segnis TaxID=3066238 RepID=UPI0030D20BDA